MNWSDAVTKRLHAACQAAQAQGLRIEPGSFGVGCDPNEGDAYTSFKPTCCPVGALLLNTSPVFKIHDFDAACLLGVSEAEVNAFVHGFDGRSPAFYKDAATYTAAEVGAAFRREYYPTVPVTDPEVQP